MSAAHDTAICDIWLIRHARGIDGGAMAGRRDIDADCSDSASFEALRAKLGGFAQKDDHLLASPARRCLQTAAALLETQAVTICTDARLWEQDFGTWEGMAFADLPDLGPLAPADLAAFAPPMGESFADLCARVWPALSALGTGRHIIVAHAGVIRAALALALGAGDLQKAHLGLGFSVGHLSLTRISRAVEGAGAPSPWAILGTNWGSP